MKYLKVAQWIGIVSCNLCSRDLAHFSPRSNLLKKPKSITKVQETWIFVLEVLSDAVRNFSTSHDMKGIRNSRGYTISIVLFVIDRKPFGNPVTLVTVNVTTFAKTPKS